MSNGSLLSPGQTYHGTDGTIDTSNYGGVDMEGKEVTAIDSTTGLLKRGRIMRNVSGTTMKRGKAVAFASGYRLKRFDGYTRLTNQAAGGVIDPDLPSAGVRNGDLCIVWRNGPCKVVLNENPGEVVAIGDYAFAATAATSQGTTGAGKVLLLAGANTTPGITKLGVFLEAATTADCTGGTMKLVDLDILV